MGFGKLVGRVLEEGEEGRAVGGPLGGGEVSAGYVAAAAVDYDTGFGRSGFF